MTNDQWNILLLVAVGIIVEVNSEEGKSSVAGKLVTMALIVSMYVAKE